MFIIILYWYWVGSLFAFVTMLVIAAIAVLFSGKKFDVFKVTLDLLLAIFMSWFFYALMAVIAYKQYKKHFVKQ